MGNAAMAVLPDGYLQLVRQICDRYGLLLIVDEVMTGAGRTGTFLRVEALGVTPDLIIMAKAISAGYAPLGAVLLHERVTEAIMAAGRRMDHVHTHSGHPVSCAVGLAVLDILEREGLVAQAAARGRFLRAELDAQLGGHPAIGEVRGVGLADAVEYVADRATQRAYPAASDVAGSIWRGMLERGYILPSRRYQDSDAIGDYSLLAPAFVISEAEIREGVGALRDTIEAVSGAGRRPSDLAYVVRRGRRSAESRALRDPRSLHSATRRRGSRWLRGRATGSPRRTPRCDLRGSGQGSVASASQPR